MSDISSILLVTQRPDSTHAIQGTLSQLAFDKIESITIDQDIYAHISKNPPGAVIIEVDKLDEDLLQQIRNINQTQAIPVILFTDSDEDVIIEKAIKSGVASYIVGTLDAHRIKSIVQIAITRFKETQKIKQDLFKTKAQLQERKTIDKAKGILMQHKHYSEDDAYKALRKMAMDKNKRIVEIAEAIISSFELLV